MHHAHSCLYRVKVSARTCFEGSRSEFAMLNVNNAPDAAVYDNSLNLHYARQSANL